MERREVREKFVADRCALRIRRIERLGAAIGLEPKNKSVGFGSEASLDHERSPIARQTFCAAVAFKREHVRISELLRSVRHLRTVDELVPTQNPQRAVAGRADF